MNKLLNSIKKGFSVIPNELIFDNSLSDRARFVFVWMAAKPDDWEFRMSFMSEQIGINLETLRKYISELEDAGWITNLGQETKGGKFMPNTYVLNSRKGGEEEQSTVPQNFRNGKLPCHKISVTEKTVHGKIENSEKNNSGAADLEESSPNDSSCLVDVDSEDCMAKKEKKKENKKEEKNQKKKEENKKENKEIYNNILFSAKNSKIFDEKDEKSLPKDQKEHVLGKSDFKGANLDDLGSSNTLIPLSGAELKKQPKKGQESPEWILSYPAYFKMAKEALVELLEDTKWIALQEYLNPSLDIPLTIKKCFYNFWGTEDGWNNKKEKARKSKRGEYRINWKNTYAQTMGMHRAWKMIDRQPREEQTPKKITLKT